MTARAGIVVTGTEVLTGRVADRNGPWLAEQLRAIGVDLAGTLVVGDRPDDVRWALRVLGELGVDLIVTSGGLGPTADDLTAEVVATELGVALELDAALEARIAAIVADLMVRRGWTVSAEANAVAVRKQAMVPVGASVLGPAGTAPGLVVAPTAGHGPPVVVLPGPPWELQQLWPAAVTDPAVRRALAGATELRQDTLRLWNTPESAIAETLRELAGALDGLEITTCLRGGELEVVTRYAPAAQSAYDGFLAACTSAYGDRLFSTDGRTVDDLVADGFRAQGATVATAESCTAGLLAGRLTEVAGSSGWVRGGLVVYSNEAKTALAGVPESLLESAGAVSAEVALALAVGARDRLGADVGVGITGIAGPGGGTEGKPVGLVYLCVDAAWGRRTDRVVFPGTRADVRARSVGLAMHLLRELFA